MAGFVAGRNSTLMSLATSAGPVRRRFGFRRRKRPRNQTRRCHTLPTPVESGLIRCPSCTQSMQDQLVSTTQMGRLINQLICILDADVLCNAPGLVGHESITMSTGCICAVLVAMDQGDIVLYLHWNSSSGCGKLSSKIRLVHVRSFICH